MRRITALIQILFLFYTSYVQIVCYHSHVLENGQLVWHYHIQFDHDIKANPIPSSHTSKDLELIGLINFIATFVIITGLFQLARYGFSFLLYVFPTIKHFGYYVYERKSRSPPLN